MVEHDRAIEDWRRYAARRGFRFEPSLVLPGHRRQGAIALCLATLRIERDELEILVRATEEAGAVRTRASGHALAATALRLVARRAGSTLEPYLASLPALSVAESPAGEIALHAEPAADASPFVFSELFQELAAVASWPDWAFAYEAGLVRLSWRGSEPAPPDEVDAALAIVESGCRRPIVQAGYR